MKKRLLASLLTLCMLVGLFPTAAFATENTDSGSGEQNGQIYALSADTVAYIGSKEYDTLQDAFDAAVPGDEVIIRQAGTYALTTSGKDIAITGGVDGVVFDNIGAKNMGGADVTFNNVTFDYYPNVNYTGLQHSGNLVYNGCTFNGQVFLYGASETFEDCVFNQDSSDAYNVWTYGAEEVEFSGCTFNSAGKSVLVYNEGGPATALTVTDTDFNASASVAGKAAIEIDTSAPNNPGGMDGTTITIDALTTATGFAEGSISGNSLWNDKKEQTNLTVTVADHQVWPLPTVPASDVAQIGDKKYGSIQEAVEKAGDGDTITVLEDHELTCTATWFTVADKTVTVDLNGKVISVNADGFDKLIETGVGGKLTLRDSSAEKTGKLDVKSESGLKNVLYAEEGSELVVESGTYCLDNSVNEGALINGRADEIVTINGGTFHLGNIGTGKNGSPWIFNTRGQNERNIIVNGGTFNADVVHQYYPFEVMAPKEKALKDNGDGTWTFVDAVAYVNEQEWSSRWYTNEVGYATLEEAIEAADDIQTKSGETSAEEVITILADVTLGEDVTADNKIEVAKDKTVTLNLGGHTLTSTARPAIRIANGADVTVKNGAIQNTASYCFILGASDGSSAGNLTIESGTYHGSTSVASVTKGTLTIEGGQFSVDPYQESYQFLLNCIDANYKDSSAKIEVKGGTFQSFDPANNAAEGAGTNFVAEGYVSKASGENYTVRAYAEVAQIGDKKYGSIQEAVEAAQDNDVITVIKDIDLANTELVLLDGTYNTMVKVEGKTVTIDLNGKDIVGAYTATDSTMLVGVFSTDNNGHLTLVDNAGGATVNVTAAGTVYSLFANYEDGCSITIDNGTYKLDKAKDSLVYSGSDEEVTINGGTFHLGNVGTGANGSPWIFNAKGQNTANIIVNDGTFNADVVHQFYPFEVMAPKEKALKENGDGTWTFVDAVAYVNEQEWSGAWYTNEVGYATLEEAIEAADDFQTKSGKTSAEEVITILADVTLGKDVTADNKIEVAKDKTVTLDLGGHTLTSGARPAIRIANGADVTVKNGAIRNTASYCFILGASDGSSAGNLTIKDGTYHGSTSVASVTKGTLTIEGGQFSVDPYQESYQFLLNCIDANYKDGSAKIEVKGGTFQNFDPANNAAEGAGTNFVAEGYKSVADGNSYTVSQNKDEMAAVVTITFDDANTGTQATLKYPSERFDTIQKLIGTNDYADFVLGAEQNELLAYVADGRASNIVMTLHDDIELDAPINFYNKYFQVDASGYALTIDGNGHTITWADGYTGTLINVESGVAVTTKNLTIDGENAFTFYNDTTTVENGQNWYTRFVDVGEEDKAINANVIVNAGNLTLGEGTKIQNVTIASDSGNGKTSNTETGGFYLMYNDDLALIKSNGGKVTMDGASITGNAGLVLNAIQAETVLKDAAIDGNMGVGNKGGIIIANGGTMVITDTSICSNKAMARSATILGVINGAEVTFNAQSKMDNNKHIGVGSNTAGAMVVLEGASQFVMNGGSISNNAGGRAGAIASRWVGGSHGQHEDTSIVLNAGTITGNTASNDSWNNASVFLRSPAAIGEGMTIEGPIVVNAAPAELDVTGGTFNGSLIVTDGLSAEITGGTFNYDPTEWCAEGYAPVKNNDGTWTVEEYSYAEWVKEQLLAGNSVTLDRDIVITDYDLVNALKLPSNGNGKYNEAHGNGAVFHVIKPGVVLDLNGHSITWDAHHDDYCNKRQVSLFMVTATGVEGETAELTIKDSVGTGKVDVYGMGTGLYVVCVGAKGTIEGGTWTNYPCKTCGASNIFLYPTHGGEMYIDGGTFEQKNSEYLLGWMGSSEPTNNNGVGTDYDATKLEITGGTFVGFDPAQVKFFDTANGSKETTTNGCAKGYAPVESVDGQWTVEPAMIFKLHLTDPVTDEPATIPYLESNDLADIVVKGKLFYANYYEMTLEVEDDFEIDDPVVIDYPMTIDLGGHTLTSTATPVFRITNGADVTVKNGAIENTASYCFILGASDGSSAGNLTIESGTYHGSTSVASVTKGTLTIEGGQFSVDPYQEHYDYLLNCIDANYKDGSAKIEVKGGTFQNFDPANNAAEGAGTNFVAEGYESVAEGSTWIVKEKAVVTVFDAEVRHSLLLRDQIQIQYYFTVDSSVMASKYGMLVWSADEYRAQESAFEAAKSAKAAYNGDVYNAELTVYSKYYTADGEGIKPRNLGNVYYAVPYAVVDGEYIYGNIDEYSVCEYAETAFDRGSAELKVVMADLMRHAKRAQLYLDAQHGTTSDTAVFDAVLSKYGYSTDITWTADDEAVVPEQIIITQPDNYADGFIDWAGNALMLYDQTGLAFIAKGHVSDSVEFLYWNEEDYATNSSTLLKGTETGVLEKGAYNAKYDQGLKTGISARLTSDVYYVRMYDATSQTYSKVLPASVVTYLAKMLGTYSSNPDSVQMQFARAYLLYAESAKAYLENLH